MKTLRNLWHQWFSRVVRADPRPHLAEPGTAESEIYMKRRNDALAALAAHGLQAHYYLPAAKIVDSTLAEACRFLGNSGYIITDQQGNFIGKIATARTPHGAKAAMPAARRPLFKIDSR